MVMPISAAEMKVNGIWNAKAWHRDNYDGDDDRDDSVSYVTQRMRMYFNFIASENLKLVYKNEIDIEWGDVASTNARNDGGGRGADTVNLETKNVYLEFMVPDTPVKATMGLQGITLHKGYFASDDFSAARFDMNFDPVSITAYWAGLGGLFQNDATTAEDGENTDASDDNWQIVASGAYKAENMDARLSFAYERKPNDTTTADQPESNDLYLVMGEFGMSFDMVSFTVMAGKNFGEADGSGADSAANRNYDGYMANFNVDIALDMATISVMGIYMSGDKEGDFDDDFANLTGATVSWAEIFTDGYSYDRNAVLAQIGGDKSQSNMWALGVGADLKPTDTTTLMFDAYYIGMVEDRTIAGEKEDEIGIEVDAKLVQKIYDNLSLTLVGAYMFAEDGYGIYNGDPDASATTQAANSGDDAFQIGMGLDFKF
jgi:hypothetical protein